MTLALRSMTVATAVGADSFESVFQRHYAELVRLAWRVCGDDADDVAQEAFLRLASHPVLQRPAPEVAAWLRRVALNLALNTQRGERRARDRAERVARLEAANSDDPTLPIEREQERRAVRAVLDALPARQRDSLLLRHAGYSYAEIAAVLECSVGSVGVFLARGERAFRARYEVKP